MKNGSRILALLLIVAGGFAVWAGAKNRDPVAAMRLLLSGKDPNGAGTISNSGGVAGNVGGAVKNLFPTSTNNPPITPGGQTLV